MLPRAFLRGLLAALLVIPLTTQASRTQCTGKQCCIKRDFLPRFNRNVSTDISYTFTLPRALEEISNDQKRHQFITESVNSLSTRNKIYDDQSASGDSTTLWRSFKRNGNYLQTPFQVGLKHLTGCTSVVIIGHGGIWASHIFEDSGMDPANKAYAEKLMLSGSKKFDVFSNHFSELNGSPKSGPGYLPEVFIINPTKTRGGSPVPYDPTTPRDDTSSDELGYDESQQEYQREYGVISRVIRGHWPQIIIREHRYHALNSDNTSDKDRLENSAAGRILFEYDAKAGGPFEIRLHLENYEFLRTVLPPI